MKPCPFVLPLVVSQRATDTPDAPGTEIQAAIACSDGRVWFAVEKGATAALDNERAAYIVQAVNLHAELVAALRDLLQESAPLLLGKSPLEFMDDVPVIRAARDVLAKVNA